jgi:UDP-2,3-diacylglucosamine hydrolase
MSALGRAAGQRLAAGRSGLEQPAAPGLAHASTFMSDLHLHADMPRTFAAWRTHLRPRRPMRFSSWATCSRCGWATTRPAAALRPTACAVLHAASRERALAFLPGNRDFLVGARVAGRHCGMQALADPTVLQAFGQRWLLTHGDALCLADSAYQQFRRQVRSPAWQEAFLAQPLAERRTAGPRPCVTPAKRTRPAWTRPSGAMWTTPRPHWLAAAHVAPQ